MKSLKLYWILLFAPLLFVGCGDDDDPSIVGTWTYQGVKDAWVGTNNDGLSIAIDNEERRNAEDSPHSFTFKADNTYQIHYGNTLTESGNYRYQYPKVSMLPLNNAEAYSLQFNIDGNAGSRVLDQIDNYVTSDKDGNDAVIVSKIKDIIQKYPEETASIVDSVIPTLEIYNVRVSVSYTRK